LTETFQRVKRMYNKVYGGKMRSLLILMAVLCVAITSMSCLPTKSTTPTISQKDVDQDTSIAEVRRSIQSVDSAKASNDVFNALKGRVDTMEVKVNVSGAGNSYDKSQLYTKTEVDTAITAAITKLKADTDQAWIKGSTGTSGTVGTSPTGSVSFATTPAAIPQVYSAATGGGQSTFYTMKIVNSSSSWQYVKPIITMSVQSSYSARAVTGLTVTMSSGACSMTGAIASPTPATSSVGNFSISPNAGAGATSTSSITIIPISGCNGTGEYQVGSGQSMDILVQISGLTTSDVTLWNVTNSISTRGL